MSHSNKHRSSKHKDSKMETAANEAVLQRIKDSLQQIDDMLVDEPQNWQAWLPTARSSMTALDGMHFFRNTARFQEQAWIIQRLQDYAFHDADSGSIRDVADWCQRSWLRVLRDHPEDVSILTGLGQNWLQKSQATLARIHHEEATSSNSGNSGPAAAQIVQSAPYVEARTSLQPSVDFFNRAVAAAERTNSLTGNLLTLAAEAYMNLGNVSAQAQGEQHFSRAIRYLRRAQAIPGYLLSASFEEYLEDYGRYVPM